MRYLVTYKLDNATRLTNLKTNDKKIKSCVNFTYLHCVWMSRFMFLMSIWPIHLFWKKHMLSNPLLFIFSQIDMIASNVCFFISAEFPHHIPTKKSMLTTSDVIISLIMNSRCTMSAIGIIAFYSETTRFTQWIGLQVSLLFGHICTTKIFWPIQNGNHFAISSVKIITFSYNFKKCFLHALIDKQPALCS